MRPPLPVLILAISLAAANANEGTPPANDDFADASALPPTSFTAVVPDILCATFEPDEPPSPFGTSPDVENHSVWYSWTAPAGSHNSILQLEIETSHPLIPTSIYSYVHIVDQLVGFGPVYPYDRTLIALGDGFTNYIRVLTAVDSTAPPPSGITLNVTGTLVPRPTNRSFEERIPLSPDTPASLAKDVMVAGEVLWYSWTPSTTGYVDLERRFPVDSYVNIYNGDNLDDELLATDQVVAGNHYTIAHRVGLRAGTITAPSGELVVRPPAPNASFATRTPAPSAPVPGDPTRLRVQLQAEGSAPEILWSWEVPEDGTLHLPNLGSYPSPQVTIYDAAQPDIQIAAPPTYLQVAGGTQLAFRITPTSNATLITDPDFSLTFFRGGDPAPITDANLTDGIAAALGLPHGSLVTPSLLLDLENLRIKARADCDDDDCFAPARPVASLEGLQGATTLRQLYLQGGEFSGHQIHDLSPIAGLSQLESLRLPNALKGTGAQLLEATTTIAGLTGLTHLSLEQNNLTSDHIAPLGTLEALETLDLDDNKIADLTPIAGLTRIRTLDIDKNPVTDLTPLASLQRLRDLDARTIPHGIRSLPPLRRLHRIEISDNELGPLARLENLFSVRVAPGAMTTPSTGITDLTPLANTSQVRSVNLSYGSGNGLTDLSPLDGRFHPQSPIATSSILNLLNNSKIDIEDPNTIEFLQQFEGIEPFLTSNVFTFPTDPGHVIPDGHLRAAAASQLNVAEDGLTPTTISQLGYLLSGSAFTLEGLQHATQLNTFIATPGWITDLSPLSDLGALRTVDLSNNQISDVSPIASLTFATLDLRGNPIDPETVPADWLTTPGVLLDPFHQLDAGETVHDPELRAAIRTTLNLPPSAPVTPTQLADLTTLHAENLRIRSLAGLEHASNLRGLSVRNNIIRDISPLTGLSQLRWLRVAGNPDTLDTSALAANVNIDANHARRFASAIAAVDHTVFADEYQLSSIRYLPLFPEVQTLYLSGNFISDISPLLELGDLQTVYLDNNFLTQSSQPVIDTLRDRGVTVVADPQRPETMGGLTASGTALARAITDALNLGVMPPSFTATQLQEVTSIDWNEGDSFLPEPLEWFPSDTALIALMPNIEYLKLERANLRDISFVSGLTALRELDLDFNEISDITPLAGLTNLQELDINNNEIRDLSPLSGLTNLLSLDVDQNDIADISPLAPLTSVIELDLHGNSISDISLLAGFDDLAWLDIRQNRVGDLSPLAGLAGLLFLDISLNGIDLSDPAVTSVLDPLRLGDTTLVRYPQFMPVLELEPRDNHIAIRWSGEPYTSYALRKSTDLATFTHIMSTPLQESAREIEVFQLIEPDAPLFFDVVVQPRGEP